jgi:hypothetical protein
MARTAIAKQTPARAGTAVNYGAVSAAAAPDGMYFDSDGSELVLVKNGDVGSHTMTVDVPVIVDGVTVADRVVTVAAGATVAWQPRPEHRQTSGQVHLNFDSATSVTVAVINLTN